MVGQMSHSHWNGFAPITSFFLYLLVFSQVCRCAELDLNHLELIDEKGSFVNPDKIDEVLALWNLNNVAGNYFIVAIEGPQSSGKSTTLNKLFKTEFEVMDPAVLKQTTTGIWMAPVQGTNLLVLDAEGSDSRERIQRGDAASERKTLAFTLAHANVLMITIWKRQLSTFNGAGLPLLQTIFERNLQLFPHNAGEDLPPIKKVLLFLILDDDGQTPFNQLKQIIRTNIEHIWENIQHNGRRLDDYFVLHFHSFPNHMYKHEFDAAVSSLRSQFHDGPGGLLVHSSGTNVPITALSVYMQRNHAAIQTDKEFNLPTQRQMVLERRMNEIVKKTLEWFRDEVSELKRKLAEGNQGGTLGAALRELFEISRDRLTSDTAGFAQVVPAYENYLDDFRCSIFESLKQVYAEHMYRLQSRYQEVYSTELGNFAYLRHFIDEAEESKTRKLQAFVTAQEEALEPDWMNYEVRKTLSQHLNGIQDATQISSRLQPLTGHQHDKVGDGRYMTTNSRLYGDGRLELDVYTKIRHFHSELHGRLQVSLKGKDGAVVASTPTFRCTTRESEFFNIFGDKGWDSFSHRFTLDELRRTAHVEIRQWRA